MARGDKIIIPENLPKPGEVYQHYKGDLYEVVLIAEHNDPDELCVIYKPRYENPDFPYFSRLLKSWEEVVEYNGKKINRFTFMENKKTLEGMCESCLMPFKKDPLGENRESEKYCSYCFNNGKLCYEGNDLKEFKKAMIDEIVKRGEPKWKAKMYAFMSGFAQRWKGQNNFFGKIFGSYGQNCEDKK